MASIKTTICFSLAVIAAAFVVSTSAADFCDTADDKVLCSQLTKGAATWPEAMTNALNGVLERVQAGRSVTDVVEAKLPGGVQPQTKDSISSTCYEAYDNIVDNVNRCLGFVKNDPYSSLRTYLSAISYSDCTDGVEEFGLAVPEATQFDDEVLKLGSALLAVAGKKP